MEQEAIVCTNEQHHDEEPSQQQQQLERITEDVFLTGGRGESGKHSEDVSDREIRALCLPEHHHHHQGHVVSADEDSNCVVLDGGDTVIIAPHPDGDLLLAESTSSSPILTGISHGNGDSVSAWQLNRVFGQAQPTSTESLVTPAEEVSGQELQQQQREKGADAAAACSVADEGEESGAKGVQKCGLSRCVATTLNLAADQVRGDGTGSSIDEEADGQGEVATAEEEEVEEQAMEGENEECTCRRSGEEEDEEEEREVEDVARGERRPPNSAKNSEDSDCVDNVVEEEEDETATVAGESGGRVDAILIKANQFKGVQSEQAASVDYSAPTVDNKNKLCDNRSTTTTASASSSSVVATASDNAVVVVQQEEEEEGDDEDDSMFSSAKRPNNACADSASGSAVLTKQQTPTSVRTASANGNGGGSFGKSESQLENPKILSKRLHRLIRALEPNESAEGDSVMEEEEVEEAPSGGHGDEDEPEVKGEVEEESKSQSGPRFNSGLIYEEMPSSSASRSAVVVVVKEEKQEDPAADEEDVDDEVEPENEMDTDQERLAAENEDNEAVNHAAEGPSGVNKATHHQRPLPLAQPDFEQENTWADCEEVGDESEEICTCQNYSDTEDVYDEDEQLPSKDVDLSSYTAHELLQEASENGAGTPTATSTTPLGPGRKRKISEAGSSSGVLSAVDSPCGSGGGQLYLDVVQSKRCRGGKYAGASNGIGSPKTPTSSVAQIPAFLRTPRSAQSMHLLPRESLSAEMGNWLGQFQKWTEMDRVTALNHIIDLCEPSQVRHVMKVIEPQFQRDFISLLPRELALQVLSYLEPTDLLKAAQTCRNWRFLCDDNLLWKDKCKEGNIMMDGDADRPKRGRAGNMPPIASPWKAAYMRQHIIEMNWRSRPIRTPKVLKGHDDHVITCLQFCGNRIVSGSDDNTLKVWSAVTGKCLRVLVGHTGGVWSSQMSSKYIISGSTDRTLKVWNAETGQCEHTLYGHTSTVRCMHLHGEKVVSGSRDATLRVWDVNRGTCLHVLVGHLAAVRCVQYDGKLVVSGAYDYTVKVWNPERQECLHTLQGHTNRVYSLQFDGIHVVSGSLDTSIRVWDAESGSCKHTLMGHQSLTSGMELRDHILVSGNADSTVRIWDIVSGQCLQTLSGPNKHQSAVTCLQFNSRFVITSSDDGTVKLWDVKTGEFIRNLVALDSGGSGGVVWRIRASDTKLICAVGSRNGTEETKLMVLDFDVEGACLKCS